MSTALVHELEPGLCLRVVTAVYFVATKLEAFAGRGKGDYLSSHDLEDFIVVVDGRTELTREIQAGSEDVRIYIAEKIRKLLATGAFLDGLPGFLLPDATSQSRLAIVLERLKRMAEL